MATGIPERPSSRDRTRTRASGAVALVLGLLLVLGTPGCASTWTRLTREILPTSQSPTAALAQPTSQPTSRSVTVGIQPVDPNAQPLVVLPSADWPLPNGHFFTQTNGQPPRTSPTGFAVTDQDGIPFWTEFRRLGGPGLVGYPISTRYDLQGRITQAFQRAILQWDPQARRVQARNILSDLEEAGKGEWLVKTHGVPERLPGSFDSGKQWDQIVRDRLALLRGDPALDAKYRAAPDPLALYGLPESRVVDRGDHLAIRLQRTTFRLWKQDRPWAKAREVTADNGGELAKQAGLVPEPAQQTEQPTTAPGDLSSATQPVGIAPTPSSLVQPSPTPATPASDRGVWQVANTDGDGVYLRRTPRLDDKLRPWPEGTLLKDLKERAEGDGHTWYKVQAPDGSVGYVPSRFVKPAP